jgi:hypothetical protein
MLLCMRAASFAKTPHLCRVPQAFSLPTTPSRAPAWAAVNGPQVRRKKDPFSPQARWGDDGARRVNMLNKSLGRTIMVQTYRKPDQYLKSTTRSGRLLSHFPAWMTKCHLVGYLQTRLCGPLKGLKERCRAPFRQHREVA